MTTTGPGVPAGLLLTSVTCPKCLEPVSVECGDLADFINRGVIDPSVLVAEAATQAAGACPSHDQPVLIGARKAELPARTLEERVAALEELATYPLHAVTPESWTGDQVADLENRLRDLYPGDDPRRRQIRVLPSAPVLTAETARALLRECVTVVKPGEMLVVRAPDWWTPGQAGQYQEYAQAVAGDAFRVLVVLGEDLAIAEPEHAPAKRESA